MKKILMALAAAACVLSGCSEDNTQEDIIVEDVIELSAESLSAGPEGAENLSVTVTSSSDWRLAGHCDWAEPSIVAGKSGDEVVFTIAPNETGEPREATFKFFSGAAVIPFKVISSPVYVFELISNSSESFKTNASNYQVVLNTNDPDLKQEIVCEDAEDGEEPWITYVERREGYGKTILNFSIAENTGYSVRRAKLMIDSPKTESRVEIDLEQAMVEYCKVIAEESYMLDLAEQTFMIRIETSIDYEFEAGRRCDWITAGEPVVLSNEKGLRIEELPIHVEATESSRKGNFAIRKKGDSWGNPLAEITVQQRDPNAIYADIEDENFREWLVQEEWIQEEDGGQYVVTKTGKTATVLSYNKPSRYYKFETFEGIEVFTELEEIHVTKHAFATLDISKLTKVRVLECDRMTDCLHTILLGSNPITEFSIHKDETISKYDYTTLTISGEKLETLDVGLEDPDYDGPYDDLQTLDVSECPALTTLNCIRGAKLTRLILKQGQNIPNLQKLETTEIVYK